MVFCKFRMGFSVDASYSNFEPKKQIVQKWEGEMIKLWHVLSVERNLKSMQDIR